MVRLTYFVHGTTVDNEQKISSGWSDALLSELGIQQAKDLGQLIADSQFDAVFCSDLKRAVESAKIVWGDGREIIPDARLRECNYGQYNAGPAAIVEPMQELMVTERFPDGESYEDVKIRVADFLQFLMQNFDGRSVAVVAHKAPQLALDVLVKGKTWEVAFAEDWRKQKAWQPGWEYILEYNQPEI